MELYDVMRSTFSAREFTDDTLDDDILYRILDNARFAPSGGNRQGWHVIIIRNAETRERLAELTEPAARRYFAQIRAGEVPWNSIEPTSFSADILSRTEVPPGLTDPLRTAAVVLVVCLDVRLVASIDQDLDRVGVVSGASIYPFVWNVLLAARHEGFGGTLTTMAVAKEPELQSLLGLPPHLAVAAVIPMGRPMRQLTRLRRQPVADFTHVERWDGLPLTA